jgi:molybdopterin molybdotransferase
MPLIKYEAVENIIEGLKLQPIKTKNVDVLKSLNMIVAEDVLSQNDIPEHDIAAQDGFAVNVYEGQSYEIVNDATELKKGQASYVMTGVKVPEGANSIVRIEEAKVIDNRLYPAREPKLWKDIEKAGEDIKKGEILLKKGNFVSPYHIPLFIASGVNSVKVFELCVAIVSIGDELVPYDYDGGVRDSVAPMIMSLLPFAEKRYQLIKDDLEKIKQTILDASKDCDLIFTIGGSSVGKKDYTKRAISEVGELLYEGVQTNVIKRGGLGIVNGKPVMALPGRVVSAAVVFNAEGLHIISRMIGSELRKYVEVELGEDIEVKHSMNSTFLFKISGKTVYPLRWGTGLYSELAKADAFGYLERNKEYKKGDRITVQLLWKGTSCTA